MRAQQPLPVGPMPTMKGVKARTRVRHIPGQMNKTERAYANHLEALRMGKVIQAYWFEPITIKLAHDTRFTPDFLVQLPDGALEFRDTKGWDTEPAAAVKERVASTLFDLFVWKEVRLEDGAWVEKIVGPK